MDGNSFVTYLRSNSGTDCGCSVVFRCGPQKDNALVAIVELVNGEQDIWNLLPCVVNALIDRHQLVLDTVVFVTPGSIPKSRYQENQRLHVKMLFEQERMNYISMHII
jgi:hypothetical protein